MPFWATSALPSSRGGASATTAPRTAANRRRRKAPDSRARRSARRGRSGRQRIRGGTSAADPASATAATRALPMRRRHRPPTTQPTPPIAITAKLSSATEAAPAPPPRRVSDRGNRQAQPRQDAPERIELPHVAEVAERRGAERRQPEHLRRPSRGAAPADRRPPRARGRGARTVAEERDQRAADERQRRGGEHHGLPGPGRAAARSAMRHRGAERQHADQPAERRGRPAADPLRRSSSCRADRCRRGDRPTTKRNTQAPAKPMSGSASAALAGGAERRS